MNTVSVIIPMLNEEINIKNFLDSYLKQTKRFNEIIIVDGDSTDKSVEVVKAYFPLIPELELIASPRKSAAYSRNVGLDRASSDFVIFMDADWLFTRKDAVAQILKYSKENFYLIVLNQNKVTFNGLRKYIYYKDKNVSFKIIQRNQCPRWKEELGFGEDRMFSNDFVKIGYRQDIVTDKEIGLTRAEGDMDFSKILRRYIWYGRTMPEYLYYNKDILQDFSFKIYCFSFLTFFIIPFIRGFYKGWEYKNEGLDIPFGMGIIEIIAAIGLSIGYFQYGMGDRKVSRD